ncbi:MAG TPA: imidazole glycerol phosphate synthase subunit HisH [Vicinamibacterales bacterium]|nr:imidazole glycerol phosphate synthase subunit HisH [Vicinamibacterales bacterium]
MNLPVIAVVDYGAGNLTSVVKGLEAAGATARIATGPDALAGAAAIVVPGVGHFDATRALDDAWRTAIIDATRHGVPLLGICLGLHWLFEGSDEAPDVPGLGLFTGRCAHLGNGLKVPHVGWNNLERLTERSVLLEQIEPGAYAYFTHSYAAPVTAGVVAASAHGGRFAAVAERRNVFGVQFHPEKSGRTGLQILQNFVAVAREAR